MTTLISNFLTKVGSCFFLPSQFADQKQLNANRQNLKKIYNSQEITVEIQDSIKLNALFIKQSNSTPLTKRKLIIRFNGRKAKYEDLDNSDYLSKIYKLGYDILIFNYRGVGKSTGRPSPQGLIEDGQAVLDYVISQGYKPENITVHGFSLGGAIATETLASNPDKYQEIKIINDRSFSSVKAIILNSTIFKICKIILLFLLIIFSWNIDVSQDWKNLKNSKLITYSNTDETIPYKASLHHVIGNTSKSVLLENYSHTQHFSDDHLSYITSKV